MQNRLDHYFSEEIRFEEYDDPMEIRLTNRKEEPLTFIITDDDDNDLNYMKEIASEEVNDLRQEYILYSKDFKRNLPSNELKIRHLAEKDQYRRFRFFSNNWKNIE